MQASSADGFFFHRRSQMAIYHFNVATAIVAALWDLQDRIPVLPDDLLKSSSVRAALGNVACTRMQNGCEYGPLRAFVERMIAEEEDIEVRRLLEWMLESAKY
jgi:hypothetical protein